MWKSCRFDFFITRPIMSVTIAIGTCVVGGMITGTLAILLWLPTLYCLFEALDERMRKKKIML